MTVNDDHHYMRSLETGDGNFRLSPLRPNEDGRPAPVQRMPSLARALIAVAALSSLSSFAVVRPDLGRQDWTAIVLIGLLGMIVERFDINLYGESRVSVSALFMITAAVSLGATAVLVVCPAVALAGHIGRGRPLYKLIFNTSVFALAALASASVYRVALDLSPYRGPAVQAVTMVLAALTNFAVSSALVATIIGYTGNLAVRAVWAEKFAWLFPHFALLGFLTFPLTLAYREFGAYGVLAFVAPVLMSRFTMKQYVERTTRTVTDLRAKHAEVEALSRELAEAYNETIHAFVSALDVRDVETHGHSTRVAQLSLDIGRALGIAEDSREWLDLKHGALLHDVGKIGVPDAILRKPGALTEEEWAAIRTHPAHGYAMMREIRFLASAAELVYSHHERFDGGGYPRGLRGEEIPLAARIFAVADTFDAITSERPYKAARSEVEACAEISRHTGTQFDPRIVAVLMRLKRSAARRAA